MISKRYRKFKNLENELNGPQIHGDEQADITLMCWGSIEGAVTETRLRLVDEGHSVNVLSFSDIYPFPTEKIEPLLRSIKTGVMIEVNYSGQFEELIYLNTGWKPDYRIHPLSGETPTPSSLYREILDLKLEELQ